MLKNTIIPDKNGRLAPITKSIDCRSCPATTPSTPQSPPSALQMEPLHPSLSSPPVKSRPSPTGASNTPTKLRRKVSVEQSLDHPISIQRLVEYFFVVSCQPRISLGAALPTPRTPEPARPPLFRQRTETTTPIKMNNEVRLGDGGSKLSLLSTPKKSMPMNIKGGGRSLFKKREHTVGDQQNDPISEGDDGSDFVLPPPVSRDTWKRDNSQDHHSQQQPQVSDGNQDNIHLPKATERDNHTFEPKVTARFPLHDHKDNPFNPMLTHFCFPSGDKILPSREYRMPTVHHFVLTNDKGRKLYGTCLTVYEEYNPPDNTFWKNRESLHATSVGAAGIEVSVNPRAFKLYIPRVLCILSIWPYVKAFREYLVQLYRLATSTNCMEAPIERYVINLCMEIPAPPPGAFEVHLSILDSTIRFWSPPARLPIAFVALPCEVLFDCLDIANILNVWYCLTMEHKVLLVSRQSSLLTVCSEILCSLLYPMKWSHLYVPMLPQFLCPMLDAPVPYLCGVSRDNWMLAQHHVSDETIVVDLDRNSVMFGPESRVLPPVPGKHWSKLQTRLQENVGHLFWRARGLEKEYWLCLQGEMDEDSFETIARDQGERTWREKLRTMDLAFNLQRTPDSDHLQHESSLNGHDQTGWDHVQEAFLRFFVSILKDYRKFLTVPKISKPGLATATSADWIEWSNKHSFDRSKFIKSQKEKYSSYLSELCDTQQFDDFITKRLYNPRLPDIIFFDQSIDAKLNRSRLKLRKTDTPFLQSVNAHRQLEKFTSVTPNTADLPHQAPYVYEHWPEKFDPKLFGHARPIPSVITAEFDRQASLAKQLRTSFESGANETAELMELYGSDFDLNPEGMSFTIFFYTYCAVIGLEWLEYQKKNQETVTEEAVHGENTGSEENKWGVENEQKEDVPHTERDYHGILSGITSGLCDVNSLCHNGKTAVDNAVIYITSSSPCPDLNSQAQAAYVTVASLAASMDPAKVQRNTSLLDTDEALAEFEEAKDVAAAQLDLAFDALRLMESRGLVSDPDVFKSLMEACGRCGDTKRAYQLIEIMKRNKLVTDNDVLVCFMASFAHFAPTHTGTTLALPKGTVSGRRASDAYSNFLRKKLLAVHSTDVTKNNFLLGSPSDDGDENGSTSDLHSESGSEKSSASGSSDKYGAPSFLQFFTRESQTPSIINKTKKKRKKKKTKAQGVTDRVQRQLVLGESLLDFLYPNIRIDLCGDTCPLCSNVMREDDVVYGWQPCEFQDLTTRCPKCQHKFVAQFKVSTTSPSFIGSQGPGTPLYCEFLSPWVLRKELGHIIGDGNKIEQILDPEWRNGRDVRATIWWNLIVLFKRYKLPFSFLLQGSFQNRLINPGPQDT